MLRTGDLDDFEPEEILILRLADSHEALELAYPEIEELEKVVAWYQEVVGNITLLNMVLRGDLHYYWDFDADDLSFAASEKGRQKLARA